MAAWSSGSTFGTRLAPRERALIAGAVQQAWQHWVTSLGAQLSDAPPHPRQGALIAVGSSGTRMLPARAPPRIPLENGVQQQHIASWRLPVWHHLAVQESEQFAWLAGPADLLPALKVLRTRQRSQAKPTPRRAKWHDARSNHGRLMCAWCERLAR